MLRRGSKGPVPHRSSKDPARRVARGDYNYSKGSVRTKVGGSVSAIGISVTWKLGIGGMNRGKSAITNIIRLILLILYPYLSISNKKNNTIRSATNYL